MCASTCTYVGLAYSTFLGRSQVVKTFHKTNSNRVYSRKSDLLLLPQFNAKRHGMRLNSADDERCDAKNNHLQKRYYYYFAAVVVHTDHP